uniref:FCP1 homology domain-containing protein n=1 Tax=Strombidium inclinatum TaxID=197538 RepID=A0A7S3N2S9_9SPIT
MNIKASKSDMDPSDFDIIKKPRTKFTSNVLRRAIPKLNIQDKIGSISMNKLNVLSVMRLGSTSGSNEKYVPKKINTVAILPKIMSLDSGSLQNIMPSNSKKPSSSAIGKPDVGQAKPLEIIRDDDESDDENDENESNDDSSGSSDSSFGLDNDDEEKLYNQIQVSQKEAQDFKDAKNKGEHLDDLVDQEMVELLNVCKRLHCPKIEHLQSKMVKFGEGKKDKKVLILDMDETMLHAQFLQTAEDEKKDDGDFVFELQSETSGSKDVAGTRGDSLKVSIKMRPYLDMALDYLAKFYDICVFTAGTQDYADACLDYLDPERQIIKHRLYRQHCVNPVTGVYVKDLRIIEDRDLKDIVLVDNSIISFAYQMDNGVPIKAYMRQEDDEELLFMVTFLEELNSYTDVRKHIRNTFALKNMMKKHCNNHV